MAHTHNTPTPSKDGVTNPTPELAEAIAKGYEPHDIGLRAVFIFLGVIVVSLLVVTLFIYGVMQGLLAYDRSQDPKPSPIAVTPNVNYAPPLQPSIQHQNLDLDDMKEMRQLTEQTLSTDAHTGFHDRHHIPIEQAIDKALPLIKPMVKTDVPSTQPSIFTNAETGGQNVVSKQ